MSPFARALLEIAREENSTVSIEVIRNKAFEKLAGGEGKSLVSTSLNGKSFNYNINLPASDLFTAATWAIRQFHKGVITASSVDFSNL